MKRLDVDIEAAKLEASEELAKLMETDKVTQAQVSRRGGLSRACVSEWLSNSENVTVETLARAAHAFGRRVQIRFVSLLSACLLASATFAEPPMTSTAPKPLAQAVSEGVGDIQVTSSGTLTEPLTLQPGQRITCNEGVVITCEYATPKPCIILADNCAVKDCKLVGKWTGAADAPITYESFHGIGCYGAQGVGVDGVTVEGFYGDGFYAGPRTPGTDRTPCTFTAKASAFRSNVRQGVSVVSGIGTFEDCLFALTKGKSPQAGIDIEPSHAQDTVQVRLTNCISEANWGSPYFINLDRVAATSPPPRISFAGCKAINTPPHQPTDLRFAAVYAQPGGLEREGLPKGTLIEWDGLVLLRKP